MDREKRARRRSFEQKSGLSFSVDLEDCLYKPSLVLGIGLGLGS